MKTTCQKIKCIFKRHIWISLYPTTSAIPLTPERFAVKACALSSGICDKLILRLILLIVLLKKFFLETVHAKSCKLPFTTHTWFSWFGRINRLSIFGWRRGFLAAISRSCGYQDCACYIVVKIKFVYLLPFSLKPHLLEKKVGKHNSTCESIRSKKHSCLCCKGLISTTCKPELIESLKTQEDPNLGFPTYDNFFRNATGLTSTRLNPSCFVTESLLPIHCLWKILCSNQDPIFH